MRRALFVLLVGLVICDAAGLESLLLREPCISVADQTPDNACPATCFRCACGQPIVASPTTIAMVVTPVDVPVINPLPSMLLSGPPHDVLHVPKSISLSL